MYNFLLSFLKEEREKRGTPFLFMPKRISFSELCKALYYEIVTKEKSDMFLISGVLRELVTIGLLAKRPVKYSYYELDHFTIHDVLLVTNDNQSFSRGVSTNIVEAYAKALGEVFERTSIRYNVEKNIVVGEEDELKKNGLLPVAVSSFPRATKKQEGIFKDGIFSKEDTFSWVKVHSLKDGLDYHIPAQTVFLSNYTLYPNEKNILSPSSHGAGAYYSKKGALFSAIGEIINRHFFLESWYFFKKPKRIALETIPKESKASQLISDFLNRGFTLHILSYCENAGIPSIICLLEKEGGWSCGGGVASSLLGAIEKAILEAYSVYTWYMRSVIDGGWVQNAVSINNLKDDFIDTELSKVKERIYLFNQKIFIDTKCSFSSITQGEIVQFSTQYDITNEYDIEQHACNLFGDVYVYTPDKKYTKEYGFTTVKVIIPKSYFFSLYEIHTRPAHTHNSSYPHNTAINPFP